MSRDCMGALGISRSLSSAEVLRLASAFFPSAAANTNPVHLTPGVGGGLSSQGGCMGRAVRLG